ncbi:MAG: acyltransferase family protein, partial [Microthrixaceae bacterium]
MTDVTERSSALGDDSPTDDGPADGPDLRRRPVVIEPLGHIPALDGLRAVAVMAVLLYHARFSWIPGGFLGVSMFFTLSGFLITSLLLREWNSTTAGAGSIDLRRFWRRRFRRLLPASWCVLGVVVLMGLLGVWDTEQLRSLRGDVPFALAEVINWHFIAQDRSYGTAFVAPSPLEHYWSLAVEQQFYVVLPLVVVGVLTLARRRPARHGVRMLVGVFVALTVVSAVANGVLARSSVDRAYFGTDTRMAEMLVGSLLACAMLRRLRFSHPLARRALAAVAVVAGVVTVWFWHSARLDAASLYPWGLLLSALCTAALIAAATDEGLLASALSVRPLVWLGGLSYGIYLLHWPIFLWLTPLRTGLDPVPLFGLRFAVTLLAAMAMYQLVEHPIRSGGRLNGRAVPIMALSAVAALLAGTFWTTRDLAPPPVLLEAAQTTTPPPPPPVVDAMVIGDQFAGAVAADVSGVEGLEGLSLTAAATADCGLAIGGYVSLTDGSVERDVDRCANVRSSWVDAVASARPDVTIVMPTLRDRAPRRFSPQTPWAAPDDPAVADFLRSDLVGLVEELRETGPDVVLATAPDV